MEFADPVQNLAHLSLKEGDRVADFGAGYGDYAFAIAKRVHDSGKVYAIDVQKELIARLKNDAKERHLSNIEVIWGDLDTLGGTKLADSSVDAVIISNILFQSENRETLMKEARRVMKSGAEALVIDWTDSFRGMGPQPEHIITEEKASEMFKKAGFKIIKNFSAGEHHWGMVVKKI